MNTVFKWIVVLSVVINPITLSAGEFQGFLIQGLHQSALGGLHRHQHMDHHSNTGNRDSESMIHGCDGGKCTAQDSNSCALHYHHSPTLALDNDAGAPAMFQCHESFELRKRLSNRVIRPEIPPPRYL